MADKVAIKLVNPTGSFYVAMLAPEWNGLRRLADGYKKESKVMKYYLDNVLFADNNEYIVTLEEWAAMQGRLYFSHPEEKREPMHVHIKTAARVKRTPTRYVRKERRLAINADNAIILATSSCYVVHALILMICIQFGVAAMLDIPNASVGIQTSSDKVGKSWNMILNDITFLSVFPIISDIQLTAACKRFIKGVEGENEYRIFFETYNMQRSLTVYDDGYAENRRAMLQMIADRNYNTLVGDYERGYIAELQTELNRMRVEKMEWKGHMFDNPYFGFADALMRLSEQPRVVRRKDVDLLLSMCVYPDLKTKNYEYLVKIGITALFEHISGLTKAGLTMAVIRNLSTSVYRLWATLTSGTLPEYVFSSLSQTLTRNLESKIEHQAEFENLTWTVISISVINIEFVIGYMLQMFFQRRGSSKALKTSQIIRTITFEYGLLSGLNSVLSQMDTTGSPKLEMNEVITRTSGLYIIFLFENALATDGGITLPVTALAALARSSDSLEKDPLLKSLDAIIRLPAFVAAKFIIVKLVSEGWKRWNACNISNSAIRIRFGPKPKLT